ncbi:hypothetical protein [Nocardia sp. NPDC127526]|uniref:hypothetical protein n=1 Tax=Nocardia sp. NPDC127526 TaxID=3345393 RepID=UPI003631F365
MSASGDNSAERDGVAVGGGAVHPPKWKSWLLTLLGLYPMLTVLITVTGPLLESLPTPLRLACILPIAVAAMTWGIMPFLTKRFAGWLAR